MATRTEMVNRASSWEEMVKAVKAIYRERKCADTIGAVQVPWAGHFQC